MATWGANKIENPSAASGVSSWSVIGVIDADGGVNPDGKLFQVNGVTGRMSQTITSPGAANTLKFSLSAYIKDAQVDTLFASVLIQINYEAGADKLVYVPIISAYDSSEVGVVNGLPVRWCKQETVVPLTSGGAITDIIVTLTALNYTLDTDFYVDDFYLGMEVAAGGSEYTDEMAVNAVEEAWLDPFGVLNLETYADNMLGAYIADLTVSRIETVNKLQAYNNSNTGDLNFWRGYEQNIDFVDAHYANGEEQIKDVYNRPLYWRTAEKKGLTTHVTSWPAMVYKYTETVKLKMSFYLDPESGYYLPKVVYGVGSGAGEWHGKGVMWKGPKGLYLDYFHSVTGQLRRIMLTDDGVDFSEVVEGKVIYADSTAIVGAVQIFIGSSFPPYAKENDVLINPGDHTIGDGLLVTMSTNLTASSPKHIRATGIDTNVALFAPSVIAYPEGVYAFTITNGNVLNGMISVTVQGTNNTISGKSVIWLPPQRGISVRLLNDPSNFKWEVV